MNKIGKGKFLVSLLAGGSILAVIIFVILSLPPFGGTVSGERLKRVQTNPQYKDGAFVNVESQTPFNLAEIGSFFSESFFMMKFGSLLPGFQ